MREAAMIFCILFFAGAAAAAFYSFRIRKSHTHADGIRESVSSYHKEAPSKSKTRVKPTLNMRWVSGDDGLRAKWFVDSSDTPDSHADK
jgi:hypothetical protein